MSFSMAQLWLVTGLVLIFMEAVTPGFVIFFFGLSAITVSLLLWIFPGISHVWCVGIFLILSVVYLLALRRFVKNIFLGDKEIEAQPKSDLVGQRTVVIEAIQPPMEGRVEVFGSRWKAIADTALPAGAEVEVVSQNNLTLTVKAVERKK